MRAILIIQEAKYKLAYLTRLFIASLVNITPTQYRTMHSKAQYKLHNRKIYAQKNYTMQITYKHLTIYCMFITNTLTGSLQYDSVF